MHSSSVEGAWADMKIKKGKRKITEAMLQTSTEGFAVLNQSN